MGAVTQMAEHDGGPPESGGPPRTPRRQAESSRPAYDGNGGNDQRRQQWADTEWRIARLTVTADHLGQMGPAWAQMRCDLLDLRDLLDTLNREGQVVWR